MARKHAASWMALWIGLQALTATALAQDGEDASSLAEDPAETEAASPADQPLLLGDEQALQEERAPEETFRQSTDPYEAPEKRYFFAGAAWRYVRTPSWMLKWFLEEAPAVGSAGSFFAEAGYRHDGFQVTAELGWMKYSFEGPFQVKGDPVEDTEWLDANLNFLMATATLTWSTAFTDWFALEYGVEGGIAGLFGDVIRTEAVKENGKWRACEGWAGNPNMPGPATPAELVYCERPLGGGSTDGSDEEGAHYGVKAQKGLVNGGVPRAIPVLGPRLSLRFKPIHQLVLRVDVPLPLLPYGFVGGIAAHFGF